MYKTQTIPIKVKTDQRVSCFDEGLCSLSASGSLALNSIKIVHLKLLISF